VLLVVSPDSLHISSHGIKQHPLLHADEFVRSLVSRQRGARPVWAFAANRRFQAPRIRRPWRRRQEHFLLETRACQKDRICRLFAARLRSGN
jgi:hypothetical protein